jgi:hypothetical protein
MILNWPFVECGQRPAELVDTGRPAEDLRQSILYGFMCLFYFADSNITSLQAIPLGTIGNRFSSFSTTTSKT